MCDSKMLLTSGAINRGDTVDETGCDFDTLEWLCPFNFAFLHHPRKVDSGTPNSRATAAFVSPFCTFVMASIFWASDSCCSPLLFFLGWTVIISFIVAIDSETSKYDKLFNYSQKFKPINEYSNCSTQEGIYFFLK